MERYGESFEPNLEHEPQEEKRLTREMLFLAEQATQGTMKALPGQEWAFHYPVTPEERTEKLQGLLD